MCRWETRIPIQAEEGVMVGANAEQDWMLPWWYENFHKHNPDLPVAFADFGMSEGAKTDCQAHGLLVDFPQVTIVNPYMAKPMAILTAPFERIVWSDLDVEILGPVEAWLKAGRCPTPSSRHSPS